MTYPTLEEVKLATHYQLGCWYRFLESPRTNEQIDIINRIVDRFVEAGGWNPQLSKAVGHER